MRAAIVLSLNFKRNQKKNLEEDDVEVGCYQVLVKILNEDIILTCCVPIFIISSQLNE